MSAFVLSLLTFLAGFFPGAANAQARQVHQVHVAHEAHVIHAPLVHAAATTSVESSGAVAGATIQTTSTPAPKAKTRKTAQVAAPKTTVASTPTIQKQTMPVQAPTQPSPVAAIQPQVQAQAPIQVAIQSTPAPQPAPVHAQSTPVPAQPAPSNFISQVEQLVLQYTNDARAQNGLSPVSSDAQLSAIARSHSADMLARNYFAHEDLSGCSGSCRMTNAGYQWSKMGENIHKMYGYTMTASETAHRIVNDWMNSAGHRANILTASFTKVGIGVAMKGTDVYTTQDFALPR